jgi:GDP-D-mannose 3',5'-epimerase
MLKKILICGGAGFIGHHLARKFKDEGHTVIVADIKAANEYVPHTEYCNGYRSLDLTKESSWEQLDARFDGFDEIYQLAADMGGAGYIFTGENDANVMTCSALINLHCVQFATRWKSRVFYSSSACIYPSHNQEDPDNPNCKEHSAYPANPDSDYGWEKLFSERLYMACARNYGITVRIARFHNIFGPEGVYDGGKEKAPAAICRKVCEADDHIEVWGPGNQTRSFLYIDECLDGIVKLMESDCEEPLNIGSQEMISINNLAKMVIELSGKKLSIKNINGPVGVMGRNSDNELIYSKLGWMPCAPLRSGMSLTYDWINAQHNN